MTGWLKDEGLSRSSIGLFGLIFVAYSINFLWSPLADRLKIPLLTAKLGLRRSWIFTTQLLICLFALQLSTLDVTNQLSLMALFGLCIAVSGATQDIAIDAYRIDILSQGDDHSNELMAAGSAMATAGWWTGYAGLGSIPFILVSSPTWQWSEVFMVLALMMAVLSITALVVNEPLSEREQTLNQIQQSYLGVLPNYRRQSMGILLLLPLIVLTIIYANIEYPGWPEFIDAQYQFGMASIAVVAMIALFARQLSKLNQAIGTTMTNVGEPQSIAPHPSPNNSRYHRLD